MLPLWRETIREHSVVHDSLYACVRCDMMLEWPTVEHNAGVITMAHILGVGKLSR